MENVIQIKIIFISGQWTGHTINKQNKKQPNAFRNVNEIYRLFCMCSMLLRLLVYCHSKKGQQQFCASSLSKRRNLSVSFVCEQRQPATMVQEHPI